MIFNKATFTDAEGKLAGIMGVMLDITERKRAEEELVWKTAFLEAQVEATLDGILVVDEKNKILLVNQNLLDIWKVPQHIRNNKDDTVLLQYVTSKTAHPEQFLGKVVYLYEHPDETSRDEVEFKDRMILDRYSSPVLGKDGKYYGRIWTFRDITERKRVEEELRQSEGRYRSIVENAQEGIFRSTPDGRIIIFNQAMASIYGYESPKEMMVGITDIARQQYVNPEDHKILKKILEKDGFIRGFESQNYKKDGSIIWVSLTMQAFRDEKGQIKYYEGIVEDITSRKKEVERERIRKALGATVHTIAAIVETRDPYTAGHQSRVADLARSIATELNLPLDRIDGIRIAASMHDLGKISVPAEILSKPTKLTNLEFNLMKTHSQAGYDILKDIDFPWPIARIVLEHHERINGSGYPNGLTGDDILLESRILAVADVVESMCSHRPYRPSLGIEAALNELSRNKGIFYDSEVSDVCLKLFREKGYQLNSA